jgi:hypothetical protein
MPVLVLYWDGNQLVPIGPTSTYVIPAGALYAMDQLSGVGLGMAAALRYRAVVSRRNAGR